MYLLNCTPDAYLNLAIHVLVLLQAFRLSAPSNIAKSVSFSHQRLVDMKYVDHGLRAPNPAPPYRTLL